MYNISLKKSDREKWLRKEQVFRIHNHSVEERFVLKLPTKACEVGRSENGVSKL